MKQEEALTSEILQLLAVLCSGGSELTIRHWPKEAALRKLPPELASDESLRYKVALLWPGGGCECSGATLIESLTKAHEKTIEAATEMRDGLSKRLKNEDLLLE